jgi:tRNA A-37 threonylcarbamoyl transferase component Bud32
MTTSEDAGIAHVGAADADLRAGEQVGEYVVTAKIGEGGFGSVFRAEHPLIGKQVAIKVLNRQYSADPAMVQRFVAEARAVNQIRHRNIIDIFGFGQLPDGRHYYVMEYLDGQPLDRYVDQRGRLPLAEALAILRGVARALDAAHAKGIAHRDLKPENVFLAFDEQGGVHPKLLDFGIAKLLTNTMPEGSKPSFKTRTGAPIGTPYYMSPEQCRGRDVDHRTDVYAFGCVTYRMLTGIYAFDGPDYMEILIKQINEEPHPPSHLVADLSAAVDAAVSWMLRKDPAERPPSLATAMRALEDAAAAAGILVPAEAIASGVQAASTGPYAVPGAPTPRSGGAPAPVTPMRTPGSAAVHSSATADTLAAGATDASGLPATAAPRGRGGRTALVAVLALAVLGGGGYVAYTQLAAGGQGGGGGSGAPAAAAAIAAPAPSAPVAEDRFVELEVTGAPEGTEVLGPTGPIGAAPGRIQLPRGEEAVLLTFRAAGYKPATREVTPRADGALAVTLEPLPAEPPAAEAGKPGKKRRAAGPKKAAGDSGTGAAGGDDTNSIEDPF